VIDKLRSLNYVNDATFARTWALSRVEDRGYGPRKITQDLKTKGISQNVIGEIIRELFDQDNEQEAAKKIILKRFGGASLEEPKVLRRAVAFLQRRGYSDQVILDLLKYPTDDP
jgi:regulatory protein